MTHDEIIKAIKETDNLKHKVELIDLHIKLYKGDETLTINMICEFLFQYQNVSNLLNEYLLETKGITLNERKEQIRREDKKLLTRIDE